MTVCSSSWQLHPFSYNLKKKGVSEFDSIVEKYKLRWNFWDDILNFGLEFVFDDLVIPSPNISIIQGGHTVRDAEHGNGSSSPRPGELPRDVRRLYHVSFKQKPPKNGVVVRYWVEGNHTKLLQRAAHCTKGVSKLQVSPKKRQRPGYMKIVFLSQNAEAVKKGTIFFSCRSGSWPSLQTAVHSKPSRPYKAKP